MSPIEQSIKKKIEAVGTPLKDWDINIYRGVLTGYNDAFIITTSKRDEILSNCQNEDEKKRTAELIRPILRGRDIKRYGYNWAELWLINTHNGVKGRIPRIRIEEYPAIKAHLDNYWSKIKDRADQGDTPYNLRNCAYLEDFDKPYIAYCEIGFEMNACLVQKQTYINNKAYLVSGRNLNFLLLFFNSKLFNRIILKSANLTGGKGVDFMSKIHVPYLDNEKQERVEDLLKGNASEEDRDNFIYDLYSLSSNERNFVQSSYPSL